VYDPTDAFGRLLFTILAMVAEIEADLIRLRTVEGDEGGRGQGEAARQQAKSQPCATRARDGYTPASRQSPVISQHEHNVWISR